MKNEKEGRGKGKNEKGERREREEKGNHSTHPDLSKNKKTNAIFYRDPTFQIRLKKRKSTSQIPYQKRPEKPSIK